MLGHEMPLSLSGFSCSERRNIAENYSDFERAYFEAILQNAYLVGWLATRKLSLILIAPSFSVPKFWFLKLQFGISSLHYICMLNNNTCL